MLPLLLGIGRQDELYVGVCGDILRRHPVGVGFERIQHSGHGGVNSFLLRDLMLQPPDELLTRYCKARSRSGLELIGTSNVISPSYSEPLSTLLTLNAGWSRRAVLWRGYTVNLGIKL